MTSVNKSGMKYINYSIFIDDESNEGLFAKWVIENYSEYEMHEWLMHLFANEIDIEDMEGTFRKHE